jgi:hypothetical protein
MHASEVTDEAIERANELYWHSTLSVNQIAEDLDLSKGALYGAIAPLESGLGCPLCGDQVVFPNRTAKEREHLDCPTCDWDGTPDEATSWEKPTPDVAAAIARRSAASAEGAEVHPATPRAGFGVIDDQTRMRTIAGGALLGAAAGLALVFWARRR